MCFFFKIAWSRLPTPHHLYWNPCSISDRAFIWMTPLSDKNLDSLLINRPGVTGAVLQSPPLLTDSFIHWVILLFKIFKTLSIPNRKSWGVEILRECSPHDFIVHWMYLTVKHGFKLLSVQWIGNKMSLVWLVDFPTQHSAKCALQLTTFVYSFHFAVCSVH